MPNPSIPYRTEPEYIYSMPRSVLERNDNYEERSINDDLTGTLYYINELGDTTFRAPTSESALFAVPPGNHNLVSHKSKKYPHNIRLDSDILNKAGRSNILFHGLGNSIGCIRMGDNDLEKYEELIGNNNVNHGESLNHDLEIKGEFDKTYNTIKPYLNKLF